MYFATFFQLSAVDAGKLIEACGDRAVIILDGRQHGAAHHQIAAEECRRRGYKAYRLHRGESFTRVSQSSALYRVQA